MKKNAVVILLIVLLALCILIGGAVLVILMDIKNGPDDNQDNKKDDKVVEEVYKFSIDERTITNIKNSKKVVMCRLVIELSDEKESKLLQENTYKVTDILIEVLRSTSEIEYRDDDIQSKIGAKIEKSLQDELGVESILRVYFNEFLTQ